jgi:hypothetical protein
MSVLARPDLRSLFVGVPGGLLCGLALRFALGRAEIRRGILDVVRRRAEAAELAIR